LGYLIIKKLRQGFGSGNMKSGRPQKMLD